MKLFCREANAHDIAYLAEDMRPEDVAEIKAMNGLRPLLALTLAFSHSNKCYTVYNENNDICAMYGVITHQLVPVSMGMVWMLASPKMLEGKRQFIRECKAYADKLQDGYDILYNYVDERNAVHIRWIEWMGFTVIKRHPEKGVEKRPFLEFTRINTSNVYT